MSCSRGKAAPDDFTTKRLFAASAGYCQSPSCTRELFLDVGSEKLHIAEMAHILAAENEGPRGVPELSKQERGAFENLILLCPACHTVIDKAPTSFPDSTIRRWKIEHARKLSNLFGTEVYEHRRDARSAIEPAFNENKAIFETYGPNNEYRFDPESEMANVWRRKVLTKILPNNRRILALFDANRQHLTSEELETLEQFRQHVDDLEARHIAEGEYLPGTTFPAGVNAMLLD